MLQGSPTEINEISARDFIRRDSGYRGKALRAANTVLQRFSFFCVVPYRNDLSGLVF